MKQYATYLRVSTKRQGANGLGIESQRKMCADFVSKNDGVIIQEFMDVESGTHRDRKGLLQAIDYCKQNDCPLVVAKLDRLARDVEFCFKVVNTGIEIHFTDMPVINSLLLGVFASVAQYERELICSRTKQALKAKKDRNEQTGGTNELWGKNTGANREEVLEEVRRKSAEVRRQRMINEPSNKFLWTYTQSQKKNGSIFFSDDDFEKLANELNALERKTPTGMEYNKNRAKAQYYKIKKAMTSI